MRLAERFFGFAENFSLSMLRKDTVLEKTVEIVADKAGKMRIFNLRKRNFVIHGIRYLFSHKNSPLSL